jgi:hypothetical protein
MEHTFQITDHNRRRRIRIMADGTLRGLIEKGELIVILFKLKRKHKIDMILI